MRLILVHGINQETLGGNTLRSTWLGHIRACLGRDESWPLDRLSRVDMPFYGDTLFELTQNPTDADAVAQGAGSGSDDFAAFAAPALSEMAMKAGADRDSVSMDSDGVAEAQGAGMHKTWLKTAARALEAISPLKGRLALGLLGQAHAYLRRPHVAQAVDALVRPAFEDDEPAIIVAHSLGTVVSYKLLREFAEEGRPRQCPLFLTLGSPLGIESIRRTFPLPRGRPEGVARWVNGADPEDFVALRPELTAATFGSGIDNIPDLDNGHEDPHGIGGYLGQKAIADLVAAAIGGA
jgi:hypothetical protein